MIQKADLPISHKQLELISQAKLKQLEARRKIRRLVDEQKTKQT